ncbi:sulfurtransferase TusA family protein, partial [Patescibacteria group bacterium]|nr:sulfurtransferase TusA family protein [Patescibacteria group bacterium]
MQCPLPIVKTKKMIDSMDVDQILKMISTDPGSINDMAAWSRRGTKSTKVRDAAMALPRALNTTAIISTSGISNTELFSITASIRGSVSAFLSTRLFTERGFPSLGIIRLHLSSPSNSKKVRTGMLPCVSMVFSKIGEILPGVKKERPLRVAITALFTSSNLNVYPKLRTPALKLAFSM